MGVITHRPKVRAKVLHVGIQKRRRKNVDLFHDAALAPVTQMQPRSGGECIALRYEGLSIGKPRKIQPGPLPYIIKSCADQIGKFVGSPVEVRYGLQHRRLE